MEIVITSSIISALFVSLFMYVAKKTFDKTLDKILENKFQKLEEDKKRMEEKDYLIVKGLMMLSEHQVITIEAMKRARIDDENKIISVNGELDTVKKNIEDYQNTWEDFLIKNQEK